MALLTTFSKVFSGLLEKTDKTIILSRFDFVFDKIKEHTTPMLNIPPTMGENTQPYKLIEKALRMRAKALTSRGETPITYMRDVFADLNKNREAYRKAFEDGFQRDVFKDALNYQQANLLTFLLAIEDLSSYARCFAVIVSRLEMDDKLKRGEKEYLTKTTNPDVITSSVITMMAIKDGPDKISTALAKIKSIAYTPDEEDMVARIRGAQTDPLKMGIVPIVGHIALFIMGQNNLLTAKLYEKAKEEKAKLELQILYLERRKEGADDQELSRVQRQIDYYQGRIDKLSAKIEDIEQEATGYEYN